MLDWLADHLAMIMFVSMFFVIFLGYPVAFIMGGWRSSSRSWVRGSGFSS